MHRTTQASLMDVDIHLSFMWQIQIPFGLFDWNLHVSFPIFLMLYVIHVGTQFMYVTLSSYIQITCDAHKKITAPRVISELESQRQSQLHCFQ